MEAAINSSKVMLFCENAKKSYKNKHKLLEDSAKVKVCKKCGKHSKI